MAFDRIDDVDIGELVQENLQRAEAEDRNADLYMEERHTSRYSESSMIDKLFSK